MEIDMMKEPDVMVYLMTGFLDSGKTQFHANAHEIKYFSELAVGCCDDWICGRFLWLGLSLCVKGLR